MVSCSPPKVLSIAGFDGSGGAGIQADLKTFTALRCYGMTVLTALPIQNTCGVKSCYELPLSCIEDQLHAIFEDIRPDAIKIGMLYGKEIVTLLADFLQAEALDIPIVLDPVIVPKQGRSLLKKDAVDSLKEKLIPLATIVTPNLVEAQELGGGLAESYHEMEDVVKQLMGLGAQAILLKGGHLAADRAPDFYLDVQGRQRWMEAKRIETSNTHGTGCTLSAAIAAYLALGEDLLSACQLAKAYVLKAIEGAVEWQIGYGNGPLKHY